MYACLWGHMAGEGHMSCYNGGSSLTTTIETFLSHCICTFNVQIVEHLHMLKSTE